MNIAGTLSYDTKMDTSGFKKDMGSVKNIVMGIGITKVIGKAVDVLSQSLDGAISRVDTLNNYPKVMKTLGYSTEQARKSIQKLSDGIEGLPTTMDEIVNNAQMLTASMDDLDKGTKTAIALNNMFLAGGQGAEAANRAFIQYNQIIAKGKVDQQSWNTLVEVAPGQMNQLAKSLLGASANQKDLYSALQDGKLSIDDLNNAVINLDKNGGKGFASFAEQAKGATGGIATSMANVRTAVVKGLANMINGINEGLAKNNLPTIQEILDKLKTAINDVFKKINEELPKIIKKAAELYEKIEPYIPIIESLAGGILAIIAAIKIWVTVTTIFTKVQAILNEVMMMNPIGLIVLAIIGLVAAFVVLWKKSERFRNFWIGLWEGIKHAFGAAIDWIKEKFEAVKKFFTKTIPSIFKGVIEWIKTNWKSILLFLINPFAGLISYLYKNNKKFREWVNKIIDIFKSLPKKIINIGKNVVSGLWEGIKNATSWLYNKIKEWVGKPIKWAKKILKINSPSKVWRDQIGSAIPEGLAVGIEANTDNIDKAVENMNDSMLTKMKRAVNLQAGKMNASASLISAANFNSIIQINNDLTSDVYLDKTKVGQAITPVVSKTLKTAGVR